MIMKEEIIRIKNISKSFPGVKALDDITLSFYKGTVHVLLGENGAGKSTLIKILSGIYTYDSGELEYLGAKVRWKDTREALQKGIAVIHQELSVIDDLSVAENIFLGREPKSSIVINKRSMVEESKRLLERLRLDINPKKLVKHLSSAEKQMIEIARAVSQHAKVVIMDEPTSSLTNAEVKILFEIIEDLKKQDVCIIYISHRMSENKKIGDTVSVLKDGHHVKTLLARDSSEQEWIQLMVGRDIRRLDNTDRVISKAVILSVRNITNEPYFRKISFDLHQGEILGIAGLVGAGRTEILRSVFGADKRQSGEILVKGETRQIRNTAEAIKNKIALIPEDRRGQGLFLEMPVVENIALPNLNKWKKHHLINRKKELEVSKEYIQKLMIKIPSLKSPTKLMSGGNQQKVILSKWLAADCAVLFMDEPTRGIDVNAKNEIYHLMIEFVKKGGSIVMVSSELPEILGISDRIMIIREGDCAGFLDKESASEEAIITAASVN